DGLIRDFAEQGVAEVLDDTESAVLWRAVGAVGPLADAVERAVWRVSVAPSRGAEIAESIAGSLDAAWFLDWGGGLVWLAVAEQGDAGAAHIRTALKGADGTGTGHATLVRGSLGLRRAVPVFEPQPAALAALAGRVKDGFDPRHILNPGRIVDGV
ncbi:MAG: 2-hydroxy-acid oxidase, partial [Stellaceae bacterium]